MRNSTWVCSQGKCDVLVRQAIIRGRYWLVCGNCRAGQTANVTSCDGRGWWASLHPLALARTWNRRSTCRSAATDVAQRSAPSPLLQLGQVLTCATANQHRHGQRGIGSIPLLAPVSLLYWRYLYITAMVLSYFAMTGLRVPFWHGWDRALLLE